MIWWAFNVIEKALVVVATTVGIAVVLTGYWIGRTVGEHVSSR